MIETLADAQHAVEAWRVSLATRPSCCEACGHDPDPLREPTIRQLTVLYAYVACGGRKQAAAELGIETTTFQNHLGMLYERTGVINQVQVAYLLGVGAFGGGK